jgi:predicted nucleic acid-binding protein
MEAGRKPRIYFDTSIPNYLFADDSPDRMEWTWRLWEKCRDGEYEIFVSPIFYRELDRCPQPKLGKMYEQLSLIKTQTLEETDEVADLALAYINNGVLREKDLGDCLHIAYAVVHGCDIILSWNFNHIVNDETKGKVKVVNAISRYNEIGIVSPDDFLKGGY